MNPRDFLDTATALAESSKESDLRTSVSRSYYAVILFYRDYFARKLGFLADNFKSGVHTIVPECFTQSKSTGCVKIGEKIKRIKAGRTKADYKLSEVISKPNAEDYLELAQGLIDNQISNEDEQAVLEEARPRLKYQGLIR